MRTIPPDFDVASFYSMLRSGKMLLAVFRQLTHGAPAPWIWKISPILDEPTCSVDTRTETCFQRELLHRMKGRSSLLIAVCLSSICDADKVIIRIADGVIVEQGATRNSCTSSHFQPVCEPGFI